MPHQASKTEPNLNLNLKFQKSCFISFFLILSIVLVDGMCFDESSGIY